MCSHLWPCPCAAAADPTHPLEGGEEGEVKGRKRRVKREGEHRREEEGREEEGREEEGREEEGREEEGREEKRRGDRRGEKRRGGIGEE